MASPFSSISFVLVYCFLFSSAVGRSEDWPEWRGRRGDAVNDSQPLPIQWDQGQNLKWKTAIAGRGHGSPIVVGKAVYLLSSDQPIDRRDTNTALPRWLFKLDAETGAIDWQREVVRTPLEKIHKLNSHASSTPASNGDLVFCCFLDGKRSIVSAYGADGDRRWQVSPGPFASIHGYSTSPRLYRDCLVVNGDHDGESWLALLRQSDGSTVWQIPRVGKTRSYSVPVIVTVDGKDQLVLTGSHHTTAFDPATGAVIWTHPGPSEQMVATVVHHGDLFFALGGFPERHLLAIPKRSRGDLTGVSLPWRTERGIPYVPSPVVYRDLLHVVSDTGIYTCFRPETGEVLTRGRVPGGVSASLVAGNGHVYVCSDPGTVTVLKAGPSFQVVAKNNLGEEIYATPALANGRIYLRTVDNLYCIANEVK